MLSQCHLAVLGLSCAASLWVHADPPAPVVGDQRVAEVIASAADRRVDFIGIGDSNQVFEGSGWDHGWSSALAREFGLFATGLISPQQNNGNGFNIGYRAASSAHSSLAVSGAPEPLASLVDDSMGNVHEYAYLADGSASDTRFTGLTLDEASPLRPERGVRFDFHYGTFLDGDGSFTPAIRQAASPFQRLVAGGPVTTLAESNEIRTISLKLAPGLGRGSLQAGFSVPGVGNIQAPFFGAYVRAVATWRSTGASMHTQCYLPGRSARDFALRALETSDAALEAHNRLIRDEQLSTEDQPLVVYIINGGINDRNESLPSLGPGAFTDGDSPEAYADNLTAVMDRLEQGWLLAGGSADEVHFLLVPTHPIDELDAPAESELILYRAAARELAGLRPRVMMVDLSILTDYREMIDERWYSRFSVAHLRPGGYAQLARRMLDAILRTRCPSDLNRDGSANGIDFGLWLRAFNHRDRSADLNRDGSLDHTDFHAFVSGLTIRCGSPTDRTPRQHPAR